MDLSTYLELASRGTQELKWLDLQDIEPGSGITARQFLLDLLNDASRIVVKEREIVLPGLGHEAYQNAIAAIVNEFCERVQRPLKPIFAAGIDDVVVVPAHDFPKGFGLDTYIQTGLTAPGVINIVPTGSGKVTFDPENIIFVLTDIIDLDDTRGIREVYIEADGRVKYAVPTRKMRIDDIPVVRAPLEKVTNTLDIDAYLETGTSTELIPDGVFIMKYSKYKELLGY